MKKYRTFAAALTIALVSAFGAAAAAPASSVVAIPQRVATYGANFTALVPAANATDFLTLTGSATMVVRIKNVQCQGISTAAATDRIYVLDRNTADTGGTFTTATAVPYDTNDVAATAVATGYTANPTVGTLAGIYRSEYLGTAPANAVPAPYPFTQNYGLQNDKEDVLRGVNQVFALNAAGASFAAGTSLDCWIEWTESSN
jgi:hypothetical protein